MCNDVQWDIQCYMNWRRLVAIVGSSDGCGGPFCSHASHFDLIDVPRGIGYTVFPFSKVFMFSACLLS